MYFFPNSVVLYMYRFDLRDSGFPSNNLQLMRNSTYWVICFEFKLHLYMICVFNAPSMHVSSMNSMISTQPRFPHPITLRSIAPVCSNILYNSRKTQASSRISSRLVTAFSFVTFSYGTVNSLKSLVRQIFITSKASTYFIEVLSLL